VGISSTFAAMAALLYDIIYKNGSASDAIGILLLFLVVLSVFCLYPQYIISDEEGMDQKES